MTLSHPHIILQNSRPQFTNGKYFTTELTSHDVAILVKAFVTYVRPLLDVWSPYLKDDIHTIKNVQRRFTKQLPGCSNVTYAERRTKVMYTYPGAGLDFILQIVFDIVKLEVGEYLACRSLAA